ncbi:hypothetical protein B0H14DRAFT_2682615, partial [Mycena olivaceomarginata]
PISTVLAFVFDCRHPFSRNGYRWSVFSRPRGRQEHPPTVLADPLLLFLLSLPAAYLHIVYTPWRFTPGVWYLNLSFLIYRYVVLCSYILPQREQPH